MATSVGDPTYFSSPSSSYLTLAPLLRIPHEPSKESCSVALGKRPPGSLTTTSSPSAAMPPGPGLRGTAKSCTVISPLVRVPVLSEQNTDTQPNVSTASIFLTRTSLLTICPEAIMSEMVTVGKRPSGTCAKSAVALFCRIIAGVRRTGEKMLARRLRPPTMQATQAMIVTKCSIWISRVDLTRDDLIPCAIFPRKVLSPMACTTHVALPFSTVVPKYAKLRASVGAQVSFSVFVTRGSGIDSPVSAELSTSMPSVQWRMRTSAGIRDPASMKITSPGTRSTGSISTSIRLPAESRRTAGTREDC
mmetsp:Transcript_4730/g.11039  ORF Transcript_4730/g.11039 Transcript_4730/m.11039 type:complete len:305 (+) Transcript_4730:761-1675(+)